ncbi:uncharacterized protein LOC103353042 [Stegastes partitus]|uniref:Gypsy retrotransposon integrase-like protein 1 n=1 Tax=Stegastes partitus TaxID=144197 RepID=A0A9Y4MTD5_9TELE|nr:PREDICTED: KRAB-A domain-containing protein 2 [Stegastes partitus]
MDVHCSQTDIMSRPRLESGPMGVLIWASPIPNWAGPDQNSILDRPEIESSFFFLRTTRSVHLLSTMEQHTRFEQLLDNHIASLCPKKKGKFLVCNDQYKQIIAALALTKGEPCPDGAKFKYWCLNNFQTLCIGSKTVLYCKKTVNPVITREDLFSTIQQCHERTGHSGRHKTWDEVKNNYAFIPRVAVELYLQTCLTCSTRQSLKQPTSAKPTISLGFLTRVQVNLIDMTSKPDDDYKWILHARDHFSKYSWAFPLTSKRASEVAQKLVMLFSMFGPPRILQSDNGGEFVASVITEITNLWPGLLIVHGRPRHPQSQGCVERNGDLQLKLGKWLEERGGTWSTALQFVTHAINTSAASATSKTPYEVVFRQKPHQDLFLLQQLAKQGPLSEETIDPSLFEAETEIQEEGPSDHDDNEPETSAATLLLQLSTDSTSGHDCVSTTSRVTEFQLDELPSVSGPSPTSAEPPTNTPTSVKRSHEYYLLHQGNIVAEGVKITNRSTLHGSTFNRITHTIVQVTSVFDESFIPTEHNPQEEPLQEDQYVLWRLDSLVDTETNTDSSHSKVRREATVSYLQTGRLRLMKQ